MRACARTKATESNDALLPVRPPEIPPAADDLGQDLALTL
jgi:hypothetical protein